MLNIILITFVNICLVLSQYSYTILCQKQLSEDIEIISEQKNLEILLLYNYEMLYQSEGILMSEHHIYNDITIDTSIYALDKYYEITAHIISDNYNYSFNVKLNLDTGKLSEFQYI